VEQIMRTIVAADFIIATRFHGVVPSFVRLEGHCHLLLCGPIDSQYAAIVKLAWPVVQQRRDAIMAS
jgi:hypothetical protein